MKLRTHVLPVALLFLTGIAARLLSELWWGSRERPRAARRVPIPREQDLGLDVEWADASLSGERGTVQSPWLPPEEDLTPGGKAIRDSYEEFGARLEWLKLYGRLPTTPLAAGPDGLSHLVWETNRSALNRIRDLNFEVPNELMGKPFQVFAYRAEGRLQVLVGPEGGVDIDTGPILRSALGRASVRYRGRVPENVRDTILNIVKSWESKQVAIKHDLYRAWAERMFKKLRRREQESLVCALFVAGDKVIVIRDGMDAKLDALVARRDSLARAAREQVRRTLK